MDESQTVEDAFYFSPAGLGTKADKTRQVEVRAGCLDDADVVELLENDGLFATLLGRIVADALRGGFKIKLGGEADPETASEVNERVAKWAMEQEIEQTWRQHFVQRNGFGGAVLLEVTADRDQSRPRLGQPKESRFLSLAPSEIIGQDYNTTNPFSPNYQKPNRWALNGYQIDPSWLRVSTTPRLFSTNLGVRSLSNRAHTWTGPSKARQFIEEVKRWGMSLQAATSALQTLSQLVLKSGTFRAAQVKDPTMATAVYWARMADLTERRSSLQPIGIDKEEDVTVLAGTITGISEILDRLMIAVAAAAEMPVTVAFGVSPGGFGTGESEQKLWSARVSEFRRLELAPLMQWTLERAFGEEAEDWQICFEPIDTPTAAEAMELKFKQAQIDAIELDRGVVQPNEVALSRHGGEYSTHTQIDVESRMEPADMEEEPEVPETQDPAETEDPEEEAASEEEIDPEVED